MSTLYVVDVMQASLFDTLAVACLLWGGALLWVGPTLLILQIMTPKVLIERYFRQPHFNLGETIVFARFPGSLLRTVVLLTSCISKRHRAGRKLESYLDVAPKWYVRTAWICIPFLAFHVVSALAFLGILMAWSQ